jgi:hypothetical protein
MLIHSVLENFREGAKDVFLRRIFSGMALNSFTISTASCARKFHPRYWGGLQFALKLHKTR